MICAIVRAMLCTLCYAVHSRNMCAQCECTGSSRGTYKFSYGLYALEMRHVCGAAACVYQCVHMHGARDEYVGGRLLVISICTYSGDVGVALVRTEMRLRFSEVDVAIDEGFKAAAIEREVLPASVGNDLPRRCSHSLAHGDTPRTRGV